MISSKEQICFGYRIASIDLSGVDIEQIAALANPSISLKEITFGGDFMLIWKCGTAMGFAS